MDQKQPDLGQFPNGVRVVGGNYAQMRRVYKENRLEEGAKLTLRREPDNQYDPNAIRVLVWDDSEGYIPIGYVAKTDSAKLALIMDAGYSLEARVKVPPRDPSRVSSLTISLSSPQKEEKAHG